MLVIKRQTSCPPQMRPSGAKWADNKWSAAPLRISRLCGANTTTGANTKTAECHDRSTQPPPIALPLPCAGDQGARRAAHVVVHGMIGTHRIELPFMPLGTGGIAPQAQVQPTMLRDDSQM